MNVPHVFASAGPEQEYFLIDRNFYFARLDLVTCGRTLYGAKPPKGQEFEDHYFGAIPERVLACMLEAERELFKLGVPAKTRHNEVAPAQYELAPLYENANVATDHQQTIMQTLTRVAQKYGMACLLHEKPFAGINGSGKHVNWSMGGPGVGNLLDPGDNPEQNAQFLVFCAAVHPCRPSARRPAAGVGGLTPATIIAWAPTKPRRRSSRSSWAISFPTSSKRIEKGSGGNAKHGSTMTIGVDTLPPLPKHATDRNRTSPFAFTGNRFEFRAVGSASRLPARWWCSTRSSPKASTTSPANWRRPPAAIRRSLPPPCKKWSARLYKDHKAVCLQRRRLLGRMARRSREARSAEPEEHDQCSAGR